MKEEPIRLFVYGTLRVGRSNYSAIARFVVAVEPATTQGALVDLGSFPALVPGPGIAEGEVLTIKPECFEITDRIEGTAHGFYQRRQIEVHLGSGAVVQAWTYFYANPERIAEYPRLIIEHQGAVKVYAWRRSLGALAPKLTAAEYSFFERIAEAARRADLAAIGRLIALAPSPRLRGHAFAAAAIHHAKRHKDRRVAMRLLKKAVDRRLQVDRRRAPDPRRHRVCVEQPRLPVRSLRQRLITDRGGARFTCSPATNREQVCAFCRGSTCERVSGLST